MWVMQSAQFNLMQLTACSKQTGQIMTFHFYLGYSPWNWSGPLFAAPALPVIVNITLYRSNWTSSGPVYQINFTSQREIELIIKNNWNYYFLKNSWDTRNNLSVIKLLPPNYPMKEIMIISWYYQHPTLSSVCNLYWISMWKMWMKMQNNPSTTPPANNSSWPSSTTS